VPNPSPAMDSTHDFLLVFGVAAVVLGVVMVNQGVPPSPVMARPVPSRSAWPVPADPWLAPADAHLTGHRSQPEGVTPKPMPFPENNGDVACADACVSRYDPRRDLRLALTDMMLQQRGFVGYPPVDMPQPMSSMDRMPLRMECAPTHCGLLPKDRPPGPGHRYGPVSD
jgi:hypothetical protein